MKHQDKHRDKPMPKHGECEQEEKDLKLLTHLSQCLYRACLLNKIINNYINPYTNLSIITDWVKPFQIRRKNVSGTTNQTQFPDRARSLGAQKPSNPDRLGADLRRTHGGVFL